MSLRVLLVLCFSFAPALWADNALTPDALTSEHADQSGPWSVSSGLEFKAIRYLDEGRTYFRSGAANSNT
ncbi:MAG: hypothetical protein ACXVA9_06260, partial [Bdellovibrionales bacterium]